MLKNIQKMKSKWKEANLQTPRSFSVNIKRNKRFQKII